MSKVGPYFPLFFLFGKFGFLFVAAVYVLALPAYFFAGFPADFLLPFEAALCLFVSLCLFVWCGLVVKEMLGFEPKN